MADRLRRLAREFDRASVRYMACDPASPAADTAGAGEARAEMQTLLTRMGILAGFDMGRVGDAVDAAASEAVRNVRLRGHYTEEDLRRIRRMAGARPA